MINRQKWIKTIRSYTFQYDGLISDIMSSYDGNIVSNEDSLYDVKIILNNGVGVHIEQGGGNFYQKTKRKTLISVSGSIDSWYDFYATNNNRWLMFCIILYAQKILSLFTNKGIYIKDKLVVSYDSKYHESDIAQIVDRVIPEKCLSQDFTVFLNKNSIEYRLEFEYGHTEGTPSGDNIKEYIFDCLDKVIHLKKNILRV